METRHHKRLACWESVFDRGVIEGLCPICHCSKIKYVATSGSTFQMLHIIPSIYSGPSESWNLLPGCGCNQNMGKQNLIDWMGTRGNKKDLMRPLFIKKYKSLVPPCNRSNYDRYQLLEWIKERYSPELIAYYADWLILLTSDLNNMTGEGEIIRSPYFMREYKYNSRNKFYHKRSLYYWDLQRRGYRKPL